LKAQKVEDRKNLFLLMKKKIKERKKEKFMLKIMKKVEKK